jgi:DNA-binding response OmpR family regulator
MLLADRTVLLVDPDTSTLESLASELKARGAKCFLAPDAATAAWGARETLPDVVVSELELPDLDAAALLFDLRSTPESAEIPAIALAANRSLVASARGQRHTLGHGFDKYLGKPARAPDVADAICCVLGPNGHAPERTPSVEVLGDALQRHDYRRLLAVLNATTEHRYSGLFRFDGAELQSLWTFDRLQPKIDAFPLEVPLASTPLALMLFDAQALCISDTAHDDRVTREQRHADMRGFAGVPVRDATDLVFGALCHFDSEARATDPAALDLLDRAARIFWFTNRRARSR